MSDKVYRAATCAIKLITQKTPPEGVTIGVVENFTCGKAIATELQLEIGAFIPVENIFLGESGHFSWGKALTREDLGEYGVFPTQDEHASFREFALRVVDTNRRKILAHIIGGLPNSGDVAINAQAKLSHNVNGTCRLTKFVEQETSDT